MNAVHLWRLSTRLHARGMRRLARLCKALNFLIFNAILEPEVELRGPVYLAHTGAGIVVHATTVIDPQVVIWQHALIASHNDKAWPGDHGVRIRSEAVIGAHAVVTCPQGRTLTIGRGARIGSGAVVVDDVPDGGVVLPEPSRVARINPPDKWPLP
jgi:serine O-acetyltransferase